MAPEMFKTGVDKVIKGPSVDIWALGVTLFNLLTKDYPFKGRDLFELSEKIKSDTIEPDFSLLGEDREQLKFLLRRILEKDPSRRISIDEFINDPWVTDNGQNVVDLHLSYNTDEC